jgi:hypothetical protein
VLEARGSDESALDTLRAWMASTMTALDSGESSAGVWERRALRAHIINAEPELRGRAPQRLQRRRVSAANHEEVAD